MSEGKGQSLRTGLSSRGIACAAAAPIRAQTASCLRAVRQLGPSPPCVLGAATGPVQLAMLRISVSGQMARDKLLYFRVASHAPVACSRMLLAFA